MESLSFRISPHSLVAIFAVFFLSIEPISRDIFRSMNCLCAWKEIAISRFGVEALSFYGDWINALRLQLFFLLSFRSRLTKTLQLVQTHHKSEWLRCWLRLSCWLSLYPQSEANLEREKSGNVFISWLHNVTFHFNPEKKAAPSNRELIKVDWGNLLRRLMLHSNEMLSE